MNFTRNHRFAVRVGLKLAGAHLSQLFWRYGLINMIRLLTIVTSVFLISACASNPRIETLTSEQRARLSTVEILGPEFTGSYTFLGTVEGLSCNRNKFQEQDISNEEALQGVKIRTVLLGGNAVKNLYCQKNSDTDWANNCWASVKCIADAVETR